jgi:MFS family permease
MDLYRATFAGSILLNAFALYQSHRSTNTELSATSHPDKADNRGREASDRDSLKRLKWRFFPIYLLVNAADWLQGPYIYPIYKGILQHANPSNEFAKTCIDEKGLHEETVAFLFLIGFVSAGISASFAGSFADRHGRRTACLAYCIIYSFSSMTLLSDNIYVLFLGRILGGISGTLLWSVFESWLVAEFNKLMLEEADTALSAIFSLMTTANTCVAIAAGLIAEWLVRKAGTAKAPFLLSIGCLLVAFVAIMKYWVSYHQIKHGA